MNEKPSDTSLAPFSCQYSPQIPELLLRLNCTIAITTYQAGKLVLISAQNEDALVQLPRTFPIPLGIAENKATDQLALACKDEIVVFSNAPQLAAHYPASPQKYDALYMPRTTYHTGPLDIHDLCFGKDGKLYAVNTLFSCVVSIDDRYNFTPFWKPPFIDQLVSEDRCHLNGLALKDGLPKYATAFNQGNSFQSWRENVTTTGVVFDLETNETVASGLAMPHSPRWFGDALYVLLSASGELIRVDVNNGKHEVIIKLEGFVRGMDLYKDYLFIGLSKLRRNSSTFGKLKFAEKANQAGIVIVHLPTGSLVGQIRYLTSLDEIYDVHIIADKIRPNILNTTTPDYKLGLMIPESTFWAKPEA
ncbi:MAG: TIGR03032 family protein [Phycisphaerae bacterium]|nr:TIGR03032 family protein [Saprospiraceae bacterium]